MARVRVERAVRARLASALDGVEVRVRVPDPRPERLVVVQRAGGSRPDRWRDRAGVHALVWAPTEDECEGLALEVAEAMRSLEYVTGFARVEEMSLRSDPDDESEPEQPRWFGSWTVTTYETGEQED